MDRQDESQQRRAEPLHSLHGWNRRRGFNFGISLEGRPDLSNPQHWDSLDWFFSNRPFVDHTLSNGITTCRVYTMQLLTGSTANHEDFNMPPPRNETDWVMHWFWHTNRTVRWLNLTVIFEGQPRIPKDGNGFVRTIKVFQYFRVNRLNRIHIS